MHADKIAEGYKRGEKYRKLIVGHSRKFSNYAVGISKPIK
jgi:hypothetical protein